MLMLTCALVLPRADGQTAALPEGLALDAVVRSTVSANPDVLFAAQQVEASRGTLLGARALFDLQIGSNATGSRNHGLDPITAAEAIQQELSYSASAQKQFRGGVLVASTVALERSAYSTLPGGQASNHASVVASATVHLWNDRGGRVSDSGERVAARFHEARAFALQHTVAERVLAAVAAYWDYRAAQERLDVLRASEQRAERAVDQTRVLVQADERTQADLTQLRGNLSSKRVSRIAAEQTVVDVRVQLGLTMGLPPDRIWSLPAPGTQFPVAATDEPRAESLVSTLQQPAYGRRTDLAATERDVDSAALALAASRADLGPRLDLVVTSGYRADAAGLGLGNFLGPLYRQEPKLDATVQLAFSFPPANSAARGRLLGSAANYEQQRIAQDDLRRRIASGVAAAADALVRGHAGMRESEEAVSLFERGVQAEQRKFQLGVSTLFDLIQSQDALTNALLARVQSRRAYAVAIATLRFQAGLLVDGDSGSPHVSLEALMTAPQ